MELENNDHLMGKETRVFKVVDPQNFREWIISQLININFSNILLIVIMIVLVTTINDERNKTEQLSSKLTDQIDNLISQQNNLNTILQEQAGNIAIINNFNTKFANDSVVISAVNKVTSDLKLTQSTYSIQHSIMSCFDNLQVVQPSNLFTSDNNFANTSLIGIVEVFIFVDYIQSGSPSTDVYGTYLWMCVHIRGIGCSPGSYQSYPIYKGGYLLTGFNSKTIVNVTTNNQVSFCWYIGQSNGVTNSTIYNSQITLRYMY